MQARFVTHDIGDGMHVHVLPTDRFKTTTVQAFWHQPLTARTAGKNALLAYVLRRATAALPTSLALTRHLQELYGASLSADVFKMGENQLLQVDLSLPGEAFLPEAKGLLAAGLALVADVLLRPLEEAGAFAPNIVGQEQTVLQRRIASLVNDKRTYALVRCVQEMCKDEPYGVYRYGSGADVAAETPASLWRHYEAVCATSPLHLYVVGAVDPAEVAAIAADKLSGQQRDVQPVPPTTLGTPPPQIREVEERQDVSQGTLVLALRTGVGRCAAAYDGLQLANAVLGGSAQSKLFVNVREKASLAYFAHSFLEASKGLMFITAGIAPEKYSQAYDIVQRQIEAVQRGDISDDEWQAARNQMLLAARTLADRPDGLIRHHLEGLVNGCAADPSGWEARVAAVTREQAVAAAAAIQPDTVFLLHGADQMFGGVAR